MNPPEIELTCADCGEPLPHFESEWVESEDGSVRTLKVSVEPCENCKNLTLLGTIKLREVGK